MTTRTTPIWLFGLALGISSCGGSTAESSGGSGGSVSSGATGPGGTNAGGANAGGTNAGGTNAGGAGADGGSSGSGAVGGAPDSFTGLWKGYVENYKFNDATDTVLMTLDSVQGQVSGHVAVGGSAPIPPPTDPNVGYPPGYDALNNPQFGLVSGFDYTMLEGSFDGQRLKFTLTTTELWKKWCELQTPIADETNPGNYLCVHNWGASSNGGACTQTDPKTQQMIQVDCNKLALCGAILGPGTVCTCTAQSCSVSSSGNVTFDMMLVPPKADGSVAGLDSSVHNVHLTHQ